MMLPVQYERHRVHIGAMSAIPGAVQAGVGIYQALRGPSSIERAQMDLGYRNYNLQQRMMFDQAVQNLRQQQLATSATTDAQGNVTEYVPGYGWVTRPSDVTRRQLGGESEEAIRRNTMDAAIARAQLQRTAAMHGDEASAAKALLTRYNRTPLATNADIRSGDILSGVAAAQDKGADVRTAALSNLVRSGGTGIGSQAALSSANDQARQGLIQTIANAYRDAPGKTTATNVANASSMLDPYNMLAGRAQAPLDVPFQGSQLGGQLVSALANTRQGSVIGSAYGRQQGQAPNMTGLQGLLGQMNANRNANWASAATGFNNAFNAASNTDWFRNMFGSGSPSSGGSGQVRSDWVV